MEFLTKIKGIFDNILKVLCIFLCGAMVVLVSWQVISRFVLQDPSAISEELANICFVWTAMLGSALLYGEKGHMNINFIPEKLGPYWSNILTIVSELFTLGMALLVLTYGGYHIAQNAMSQTNAAMLWLKIGQIYSVVPIAGAFIVFYAIYNILTSIKVLLAGKDAVKAQ
ncbi:TRAP transporter small permease [Succinatimonas hippei]|uniref:TRAP transporter small permease n=1 Tax=Succinatimonas hippei TaxID=626938 RepID=UPI0025FF7D3D|nr:TRAP transporter small permease [Succinatimonas hippei]